MILGAPNGPHETLKASQESAAATPESRRQCVRGCPTSSESFRGAQDPPRRARELARGGQELSPGGADAPCAASGALKTNVFSTAPMEPSDPPNASKGCPRAPRRPKRSLPWLQAAPLGAEESKPGRSRPPPGAPKRTLGGHKKSHEPQKNDLRRSQSATESVQSEQEKR